MHQLMTALTAAIIAVHGPSAQGQVVSHQSPTASDLSSLAPPTYETRLTVAKDGSGDYETIQSAIDATKAFPWTTIEIHIKDGIYREKVNLFEWNTNVSLIGESRDGTVISHDDFFDRIDRGRNSTFHSYTMRVAGNDFRAENLTIENTAGPVGQAVALHVEADRVSFSNIALKGYQDTLYVAGEGHRTYFSDCYIEGSVDFIFGEGTAVFDGCEIHSVLDGYVTAASTPRDQPFGFVFLNCRLTAGDVVQEVYLGRPWRHFAKTVFIGSWLGPHVSSAGWHNWDDPQKENSVLYAEYGSTGPGAHFRNRATWSRQMSNAELEGYTLDNIFRGWSPR